MENQSFLEISKFYAPKYRRTEVISNVFFFIFVASLRNLMEENYKEIRGYSLKYFWSDVLEDKELSILMDEKKLVKRRAKAIRSGGGGCIEYDDIVSSDGDDTQKFSGENDVDCRLKLEPDDKELFCVGRSYGTQDFVGQRVLQVGLRLEVGAAVGNCVVWVRDSLG